MRHERFTLRIIKWTIGSIAAVALGTMLWRGCLQDSPIMREPVVSDTGIWSMRLLLFTMALSPLSRMIHQGWLRPCRRVLGLAAFAFAVAHALFYLWSMDMWTHILRLMLRRPYLMVGIGALILLMPLALTSSDSAMRRMGAALWRRVHLAVYAAAILGLAHESLYSQDNPAELALHALVLGSLCTLRFAAPLLSRVPQVSQARRLEGHGWKPSATP